MEISDPNYIGKSSKPNTDRFIEGSFGLCNSVFLKFG